MPVSDKKLNEVDAVQNVKDRPHWDIYYLTMAYIVAQRSFDASSKCGCVIVSKYNSVLSTGYNGPIKGSIDVEIPVTRPEKYCHMLHGEENALLAYNGSKQDIQEATAYVTGRPCHRCLRMMIQKGITRIIHSENPTMCVDQADLDAQEIMLRHHPEVIMLQLDICGVQELLNNTNEYINHKIELTKEMDNAG